MVVGIRGWECVELGEKKLLGTRCNAAVELGAPPRTGYKGSEGLATLKFRGLCTIHV